MSINLYSALAWVEDVEIDDVMHARGYIFGILVAWLIQAPSLSRNLSGYTPKTTVRPGFNLRFILTFSLLALLDADRSFLYGLLVGNLILSTLAFFMSRLQLAGLLFQVFIPALALASVVGVFLFLSEEEKGNSEMGAWLLPLALSLPTMIIGWSIPLGKSLYWRGSWYFPYPRKMPPGLSRDPQQKFRHTLLPGQSPLRGIGMWLAAWPCCIGSLGISIAAIHQLLSDPSSSVSGFCVPLVGGGVIAYHQSRKLFLRGRRHLSFGIESPDILHPGTFTLYLRPFKEDQAHTALKEDMHMGGDPLSRTADPLGGLLFLPVSNRDEEEHIADALKPIGPLVAVGAPGEFLPFAGAVRMYLPQDSWHEEVSQLIARARLVTLTLGSSKGTVWELSESIRILPPQRLILMLPRRMSQEEYEGIRMENERNLRAVPESDRNRTWVRADPPSLPRYASAESSRDPVAGLISFSPDWKPIFTPLSSAHAPWQNLGTGLIRGLRPAFGRLTSYEEETGWHCG
ncbi:hypothetical protein OHT52_07340 [Streptomyces sp. NBC_00247]|uniref:hypothetical protein n=1 Tax=Streptomyces sp. NBC_00247 TaxID=2975689 RepID=UPI002E2A6596|nr:hypothetical protein [Streptomyces sp. NBC_00247]